MLPWFWRLFLSSIGDLKKKHLQASASHLPTIGVTQKDSKILSKMKLWIGGMPGPGCPPTQDVCGKWRFRLGSPTQNVIILVVTVTGRGDNPNYGFQLFGIWNQGNQKKTFSNTLVQRDSFWKDKILIHFRAAEFHQRTFRLEPSTKSRCF